MCIFEIMHPERRGFVLPTTLMVMTLLTVMLTAAFTLVSAEYRTTDNSFGRARAHALAQAGLQSYFAMSRAIVGSSDSVRVTLTGGYVDVVARRLRDSTTSKRAVWLIRATATSTDAIMSGQVNGRRTIAQLATYSPATFPAQAALFSAAGVYVTGTGSNPLDGGDGNCGGAVPNPGLVTHDDPNGYREEPPGGSDPAGTPNWTSARVDNASQVIAAGRVDWPSLLAGNFTPDYVLPAGPVNWATQVVVLIQSPSYTLSGSTPGMPDPGEGIIVVTGNLTLGAGFHWHGIILVGGYLKSVQGARVHGMTMTGLNWAVPTIVAPDTINRNSQLHWRSCEANPAVASLASLTPVGNAWVDTWSTY